MELTRRYRFSASHRLHAPELSEAENREIFGKCNNPFGHGHDYVLEVSVAGEPGPRGVLAPLGVLDELVAARIVRRYDHKNLNEDVVELQGKVPTTEVVAEAIESELRRAWPAGFPALARIGIFETDRNIFETSGSRRLEAAGAASDSP